MINLEIKNLTKQINNKNILNDISFKVHKGEFLSILGPSGCGKTTLLKILIGIIKPTSGTILKDKIVINDTHPSLRGMGIVFQDYTLFPNMTALENVTYVLSTKTKNKEKAKKESLQILKELNMEKNLKKYPHELSGGERQRVAIAQTIALKRDIILFDEPLSALDANNKLILRKKIKDLQKKYNITMIYVTHDQEEAFSLSDKIMILNEGKIEQFDTPNNIYTKPINKYVENFVTNHIKEKFSLIEKCTGIDL